MLKFVFGSILSLALFAQTFAQEKAPEFSTAGFFSVAGSQREVSNFNVGWRFFKGSVAGAEKTDFDDSQ